MLLAIDVGNTNVTLGLFELPARRKSARAPLSVPRLIRSWRLSTVQSATADEYGIRLLDLFHYANLESSKIRAIALASVVPPLDPVFRDLSQNYFHLKPKIIDSSVRLPIKNLYRNPSEVGADRLVDSLAAYTRWGGPCVIVDFGTATTFDCVSRRGEYLGGLIVPGPGLAAESLSLRTAKLPRVEVVKPRHLIGADTMEAIQSGLYYGYVALVDGILGRLKRELGPSVRIVATGGLSHLMVGESRFIKKGSLSPDLTLEGIYLAWQYHS